MTDDKARAEADRDAAAGTPPDGWLFVPQAELDKGGAAELERRMRSRQPEMSVCRWTIVGAPGHHPGHELGVWLEFWRVQPTKQAAFRLPPKSEPRR